MSVKNQEISIEQAIIREPLTIDANATVAEAIALMSGGNQLCNLSCDIDSEQRLQLAHAKNSCILVTAEKKLIGIVTERDLIKLCGHSENIAGHRLSETTIAEVMVFPVYSLLDWEFTDILVPINRFQRFNIRHLPLVNDRGEVVGLLTHESLRQLLRPIDMLRLRKAGEVVNANAIHARSTDSVTKIANLMTEQEVSSIVIVEQRNGRLLPVGIVTEGDIVQFLALALNLSEIQAQTVMSFPVVSVRLDATLWQVRELMQERMINHIVVTDVDGQMEGIITQNDLLQTLQPMEVYKLVATMETKMSRLEQEKLELLESRNKLLESQVKETNAALIDSNDMFRQFAENNLSVIVIRETVSGKLLYVSPAYETIWGVSCASLYQEPNSWMQSIHPEDIEDVYKANAEAVVTGFASKEYRIIRPDGQIRWIWGRCFPIKNSYGEIYRIAAIIEDISDRKKAEIALQESESKQKALINALPDLIIRMSGEGIYLDFISTDNFEVLGGEDLIGTSIYDTPLSAQLSPPLSAMFVDMRMKYIREAIRTGDIQIYDQEITLGDRLRIEEVRITVCGENEVLVIVRDISDRKLAEIALRESEERLKASELLLNSMFTRSPVGLAITDIDGKFVRTNPCYQAMVGYSESELESMRFTDITLAEDLEENLRMRNLILNGECDSYQIEKRFFRRDGSIVWGRATSSKILDRTGQTPLFIGILEDISDRKQAEESLQSLVEGAAAKAGDNFLPALVEYIANVLQVRYVYISKKHEDFLEFLIVWVDGQLQLPSTVPLKNSPCALTIHEGSFFCTEFLQQRFQNCELIADLKADSYLGIAIVNSKGEAIGSLCVLDDKPITNLQRAKSMLQVFAARVSAELERQEAIEALSQLNQQLEARVEQRTREVKFANHQLIVEMAERQKLIALVENSTDFIALVDRDGHVNYINPAGRELVGWQAAINNLTIFDFHFPEDRQYLKENIIDSIARDETWEGEFRLRHSQTQEEILVLFSAFPVQNSWIDETFSLACIVRDISDRKKAEAVILQANEKLSNTNIELARATKLKDEFLANMSHELRTPLNAILGMAEGLMSGVFGEVNERQRRSLSLIETSGQHLLELINDILDVAKIGAGKLTLEISPVEIEHLCRASLNFVKQMATQKNIQLNLSVQPNLGAIAVDERRMRQALINLLSNAVKFTSSGGQICLEVKLVKAETTSLPATTELHNAIVFSVIDTGIGIAPEDISKLFQTFIQIDSSLSRQYAGTGLGLTLVKQIAELHNGYATVTSQVGEGSCFSILLPYTGKIRSNNVDISSYTGSQSDSQNVSQSDKIDGITVNRSENNFEVYVPVNPLILLAEDSQANIETFSDYLSNRGYRLIFAANGQEAIDMAIAHLPDLILMDIQMPVLDGFGAIQQIRANPDLCHIPIVALTALAMDSDRAKCLQAGVNDYLSKPVKLSKLATIIQNQLQNSKNSKDEDSS